MKGNYIKIHRERDTFKTNMSAIGF